MKVISGGQNGVDQAGLRAAKACNLETGGWLPKGCITLDGKRPDLLSEFQMLEHDSSAYPPRTEKNVQESDGTLRFARLFSSAGEKCTLRAIKWFNKPYFDVHVDKGEILVEPEFVVKWLLENEIKILNIAGNSETTSPGIGEVVEDYLMKVFELWIDSRKENR